MKNDRVMPASATEQDDNRSRLLTRGLRLEYATLGWNVVGTVILIIAALRASSIALAGFGLDSLIEILASTIVVWQLKGADQGRERTALRVIAAAFAALSLYVLVSAVIVLATGHRPMPSPGALVWLAITVVVMLALAWGKHATGALGNQVLMTEARVTMVDAYLAFAVLVGVGLDTAFGWWWADPLAGLVIVIYGLKEAREAWGHASGLAE